MKLLFALGRLAAVLATCAWLLPARTAVAAESATATEPAKVAKPTKAARAVTFPFASEIAAFEASDRTDPPPANSILFLGSSSIRMWKTLAADFAGLPVVNRGFGGSQIVDSIRYFDRIVLPYHPKLIVFYAGANDINAKKSPDRVLEDFRTFATRVRTALPGTRLAFIAISPNPARWSQIEQVRAANQKVQDFIRADPMMRFIDTHSEMLGTDHQPKPDIFVADRLHMNPAGYRIWTRVIGPYLNDWPAPEPKP